MPNDDNDDDDVFKIFLNKSLTNNKECIFWLQLLQESYSTFQLGTRCPRLLLAGADKEGRRCSAPCRLAANATDITKGRPHLNGIITAEGINTLLAVRFSYVTTENK
jgi:hypothetical protein